MARNRRRDEAGHVGSGAEGGQSPEESQTRERILEAADELFGQRGFDATPTRLIAERSGVNKALIHYHFGSKQRLFDAVLDRYYERLGQTLGPLLQQGGDARARVLALLDGYADFLQAHQRFSQMVQREITRGRHLERIRRHMLPLFVTGAELLREEFPGSEAGPLSAPQLLISFYGMVVSYFTYYPVVEGLLLDDPLSDEQLAARKAHLRRMAELVLAALRQPDEAGRDAWGSAVKEDAGNIGARERITSKDRGRRGVTVPRSEEA